MKRLIFSAAALPLLAGASYAQDASDQFNSDNPPEVPDVEITGHILKPAPLEVTEERLEQINLPEGFEISIFAEDLINPRMLAVHQSGAVFVTRRDTGDLVRLDDEDGDGVAESQTVVANRPGMHGIAIDGDTLYLVTVKELYRSSIDAEGGVGELQLLLNDLPDGGQHPNRTIQVGPDGMLYLSVGSTCNACPESNPENATILQLAPDGSMRSIYASGLRNTIGFAFSPDSGLLYGMDHGTDWLGDNEQHEELNIIVKGGNYGWPYIYDNGLYNPADEPPGDLSWSDWEQRSIEPIGLYVAHAAPMQLTFYTGEAFPADYRGDAFVAMRGSWNRNPPSGYEVLRIDFENGEPVSFAPFATGFLMQEDGQWGHLGRLAGIAQTNEGDLLLSDDTNGVIYRISYTGDPEQPAEGDQLQPTNPEGSNITLAARAVSSPPSDDPNQLATEIVGAADELTVSSPDFEDGEPIPAVHGAEQQNFSPALEWSPGPEGTESYVVIMEDPDVPEDIAPFVHWLVYNIPADTTGLSEGVPPRPILEKPKNALQGSNDRGSIGYFGPRPPAEDPAHTYYFQVFALDTELELKHGATRAELLQAMSGHVLAAGTVRGTYDR